MIEIIKELNIEVSKPNVFQAVVAKQYDMNTRFIKATFVDNGDKITIPQSETLRVIINALRPDGIAKGFDGEINDDGTVTVPLHSWMLEQVGTVVCDISVIDMATDDNKKLTTTSFTLIVEKAAWGGDGTTSDPQYDVLVEMINICSSALPMAEEAIRRAEGVKGVYVGSGDMPDEYVVQIDPDGDAVLIDTELDEESGNPIANSTVAKEFSKVRAEMDGQGENIMTNFTLFKQGFGAQIYFSEPNGSHKQLISNPEYQIDGIGDYHLFAFCIEDITKAPSDFAATLLVPVCMRYSDGVDFGTASMRVYTVGTGVTDIKFTAEFSSNKITIKDFTAENDNEQMFATRLGITGIWAIV